MLEVIGEKCKHTNEQEVNYTAYCDQLTFSNPVHLTTVPKTDSCLLSMFSIFAQYYTIDKHRHIYTQWKERK